MLHEVGVAAEDVIGIGTESTACTMLPIDEASVPLCLRPEWRDQGRRQDARQVLAEVYSRFAEGLATHDLQATTALLKRLP